MSVRLRCDDGTLSDTDSVPDSTTEDSTAEESTAELYLTTTLRRNFYQNADSTLKMRSFSKNTYPTACGP